MNVRGLFRAAVLLGCNFCACGNTMCGSAGNTLADYISLGTCVDNAGMTIANFSFSFISSLGGVTPISAADIDVILWPNEASGSAGYTDGVEFVFDSQGLGAGLLNYLIGFTFDASGSLRDILDPGTVNVTTGLCVGAAFDALGNCHAGFTQLSVSNASPTATVFGSASSTIWGIQDNFSWNLDGTADSSFNLENDMVPLPEPGGTMLVASGLALFFLMRRYARSGI